MTSRENAEAADQALELERLRAKVDELQESFDTTENARVAAWQVVNSVKAQLAESEAKCKALQTENEGWAAEAASARKAHEAASFLKAATMERAESAEAKLAAVREGFRKLQMHHHRNVGHHYIAGDVNRLYHLLATPDAGGKNDG